MRKNMRCRSATQGSFIDWSSSSANGINVGGFTRTSGIELGQATHPGLHADADAAGPKSCLHTYQFIAGNSVCGSVLVSQGASRLNRISRSEQHSLMLRTNVSAWAAGK
jgi:hypothetical protein